MYDPETAVCETAARFLEEVCEDIEALQVVVEMNPTFEHLGETAHPLLLKYGRGQAAMLHRKLIPVVEPCRLLLDSDPYMMLGTLTERWTTGST
jgi:hypothetical protein